MSAPIKVALCGGALYRHDAVSESLQLKLDLLRRWRAEGAGGVDVKAFVVHADQEGDDVRIVPDAWSLVRDPWFASSAVRVYEFGIYYSLFDSVFVDTEASSICVFHNVTPVTLVEEEESRRIIERSMVQIHNIAKCDEVLCVSEFNADSLTAIGIDRPMSLLPLPPHLQSRTRGTRSADVLSFAFLGRFVRAKGVFDLLPAFARARHEVGLPLRLTVAGSERFSNRSVMTEIITCTEELGIADAVQVLVDLDDDELADVLSAADVLILPSYHEGYGVPVMEGFAAGCEVIVSDAGALPETAAGLGTVVPTGDISALADAIAEVGRRWAARRAGVDQPIRTSLGDLAVADWTHRVKALCDARSAVAYELTFSEALRRAMSRAAERAHQIKSA